MWQEILNLAISNGLFAVLFMGLLIYQLKDSRTREEKYQSTIESLGKALLVIEEIKDDVSIIKTKINSLENTKSRGKDEKDDKKSI